MSLTLLLFLSLAAFIAFVCLLGGSARTRRTRIAGARHRRRVERAGCHDPLIVSAGGATVWAWAGSHGPPPATRASLERLRLPEGVRVAIGSPGFDVAGFRSSHAEAVQAHRIALLTGEDRPQVTWYRDQELASLLTNDLERARSFALRELGGLASSEPSVARLRETLRLYLQTWGSHVRTAELLNVHQNTVAYRIRRAEELRGRPACERRPELEAALLLVDRLGDEILAREAVS